MEGQKQWAVTEMVGRARQHGAEVVEGVETVQAGREGIAIQGRGSRGQRLPKRRGQCLCL